MLEKCIKNCWKPQGTIWIPSQSKLHRRDLAVKIRVKLNTLYTEFNGAFIWTLLWNSGSMKAEHILTSKVITTLCYVADVVHDVRVRLCLWTEAMNGPTVHPQVIYDYRAPVKLYWHGKTEELAKEPLPVPLCPPQIALGLIRARTRAFAMRHRGLIARVITRSSYMVSLIMNQ